MSVAIYPRELLEPYMRHSHSFNGTKNGLSTVGLFNYCLSGVYVLLLILGSVGNVWAISVLYRLLRLQLKEPPKNVQLLILTLCVTDLVVLAFMPFTIDDLVHGEWTLGDSSILCKAYLCIELLNKFFGPFTLVALSITCYMCVCKRPELSNNLRLGALIVMLCLGILLVLMAPVFAYGDLFYLLVYYTNYTEPDRPLSVVTFAAKKCMFQNDDVPGLANMSNFIIYTFVFAYVLPSILFTCFYVSVLRYVKRHARLAMARSLVNTYRVTRIVLGLICFFVCCWTPFWIFILYAHFRPQYTLDDTSMWMLILQHLTHLLPYVNCLGYPIIYIALNRRIKENVELVRRRQQLQLPDCLAKLTGRHRASSGSDMLHSLSNSDHLAGTNSTSRRALIGPDPRTSQTVELQSARDVLLMDNVNELMQLSKHVLIPLLRIDHEQQPKSEQRGSMTKEVLTSC